MRPSISIHVLVRLAAQEAVASEYEYIEPEHLFMGILKFAECDEHSFEIHQGDDDLIHGLLAELQDLRAKLEDCVIRIPNGTRLMRHELRKRIGKAGCVHDGLRTIRRSEAAWEICQKAESLARHYQSGFWSAAHLFDAFLDMPSREVKQVLSQAGVADLGSWIKTPWLDRYGRYVMQEAVGVKTLSLKGSFAAIKKDPVCKVLMDSILKPGELKIFLIQTGRHTAAAVIENIAHYLVSPSATSGIRRQKIIEIDLSGHAWQSRSVSGSDLQERMNAMFLEAEQAGNVVIFLNQLQACLDRIDAGFCTIIKDELFRPKLRLIGGSDEDGYHRIISEDSEWKRLLRPLWIHDLEESISL